MVRLRAAVSILCAYRFFVTLFVDNLAQSRSGVRASGHVPPR